MLILLLIIIVLMSFTLVCINRNKDSVYFLMSSLSLCILLITIAMFIAKKGGVSAQLQVLLYGNADIKYFFQYFVITTHNLGYWLALGRYSFPLIFLLMCKDLSYEPSFKRWKKLTLAAFICPVISIVASNPTTLIWLIERFDESFQVFLVSATYYWCLLYVMLGFFICIYEYRSISIIFFKQRFLKKILFVFSMGMIYILYCRQDPAQVYLFYRSSYFNSLGLWYLSPTMNIYIYFSCVFLSGLFCIMGFYSLIRYAKLEIEETQSDIVYKRRFEATAHGSSIFIHSIKNQLIQNKILLSSVKSYEDKPLDEDFWNKIELLENTNQMMMKRIEELYDSIKTNSIFLVPVKAEIVIHSALEKAKKKYPDIEVEISIERNETLLADATYLSEALYNLIINGYEACESNPVIILKCHSERMYTMLEVKDNGKGLSPSECNKIFDPFYSSKHSNYNWGMGLCYVQKIISSHYGRIKVESKLGVGTQIFLLLPRYDKRT